MPQPIDPYKADPYQADLYQTGTCHAEPSRVPRQSPDSDVLISVCAVVGNSSTNVEAYIARATQLLAENYRYFELLLIDNGTNQGLGSRIEVLQRQLPNIRVVRLSREYGNEVAIAAALDNSIGDYVIVMDIDTDPIDVIPTLVTTSIRGYDVVIAEWTGEEESLLYRWASQLFYGAASRLLGYSLRPNASYFRVFSRRFVNSLTRIRSKNRYLRCLNGLVGFSQASIPYHRLPSSRKVSSIKRLYHSASSSVGIIISNSAVPLRFASLLGLLACMLNLLYLFYVLAVSLVKRHIAEGWITTSITQSSMFLMLFLMLSILSEYIARILDETKEQPLYFVEYETTSTVSSFDRNRLNVV